MWVDKSISARLAGSVFARYVVSGGITVAALLASYFLARPLGSTLPYIILFPAIAFSAWYGGTGPVVLSMILAVVGLSSRFFPVLPFGAPAERAFAIVAFVLASGVMIAMGEARRRHNEKLRHGHAELEARVRERTAELDTANTSLRDLSARLLQLQDEERRRIARELHDSVGQLLVSLSMNLSAVRSDIDRLSQTAAALADSEGLVQEMSKEVRTISHLLHPPLLDEAGLASAVRWYIDGYAQRSKIDVSLDFPEPFGRLAREQETALFRVVQECLTNIHRHSESLVARIRFRYVDNEVLLVVEDRGKGIPSEKVDEMAAAGTPGVGIRGMRERLRQLGGDLDIKSDGKGTIVSARLPIVRLPLVVDVPSIEGNPTTERVA